MMKYEEQQKTEKQEMDSKWKKVEQVMKQLEQKILDMPNHQESNATSSNPTTEPNLTTNDQNPPSQELEETPQAPEKQDKSTEEMDLSKGNQDEQTSDNKPSEESIPDPPDQSRDMDKVSQPISDPAPTKKFR